MALAQEGNTQERAGPCAQEHVERRGIPGATPGEQPLEAVDVDAIGIDELDGDVFPDLVRGRAPRSVDDLVVVELLEHTDIPRDRLQPVEAAMPEMPADAQARPA